MLVWIRIDSLNESQRLNWLTACCAVAITLRNVTSYVTACLLHDSVHMQVAFWAFPQDIYRIRAYAHLTDSLSSWRRAVSLVKEDKIKEMWQVGMYNGSNEFLKHSDLLHGTNVDNWLNMSTVPLC